MTAATPCNPGCTPCPRLHPRASRLHDAAVDLFLLARCDVLLVSPMSSFGSFAHGYASSDAPPWKVTVYPRIHYPHIHPDLACANLA